MELREKIVEIVEQHENNYHDNLKYGTDCQTPQEVTGEILALFPRRISVEKLREEYGYAGKPKQWQIGFDAALKEKPCNRLKGRKVPEDCPDDTLMPPNSIDM